MIDAVSDGEAILRVLVAAGLGGLIGFDRERQNKAAGIRTHMLVAMGAALFMVGALLLAEDLGDQPASSVAVRLDPTRVIQGIVTGVGFIGAGQIFQSRGSVHGLTSAAGIWVTAGIGMLLGLGHFTVPIVATVVVIVIIAILGWVEARFMPDASAVAEDKPQPDAGEREREG